MIAAREKRQEDFFMKKIISAFALAAMVATAAFAADPKVSVQARVKANLVTSYVDGDDDLYKDSGVALPGDDTFGAKYTDETAGAEILLKGTLASVYSNGSEKGPVTIDDYYGWMKFGALKVTAGEWEHRYISRVKDDLSSFGGICDLYYGPLAFNATKEGFFETKYETDNITPWKTEFALDYSIGDAVISASTGNDSASAYNAAEFYGARVGYKIGKTANFDGTFSMRGKDKMAVGLFAEILAIENLSVVAGYSGYLDNDVTENSINAAEIRARYVMDKLSFTSHNNFSFGDESMILFDMLNVAYKLNEVVTPAIMVANTYVSGDNTSIVECDVITVRPGLTLSPRKGATIDAGGKLEYFTPKSGDGFTRVSVPVVFRVKF